MEPPNMQRIPVRIAIAVFIEAVHRVRPGIGPLQHPAPITAHPLTYAAGRIAGL